MPYAESAEKEWSCDHSYFSYFKKLKILEKKPDFSWTSG